MSPFFVCIFLIVFNVVNCKTNCRKEMKDARIIPTYADYGTSGDVELQYKGKRVQCGKSFSVGRVQESPLVIYDTKGKCNILSIIMFDPDTPMPQNKKVSLHWFYVNIPSKVMKSGFDKQAGQEFYSYNAPAGATDNHRYTLCVYCQKSCIPKSRNPNYNSVNRYMKNPRDLAEKFSLGNPSACIFYYAAATDTPLPAAATDTPLPKETPIAQNISDVNRQMGNRDKTLLIR